MEGNAGSRLSGHTANAEEWTREFFRLFDAKFMRIEDGQVFEGEDAADLLFAWFANAIETGRMFGPSPWAEDKAA